MKQEIGRAAPSPSWRAASWVSCVLAAASIAFAVGCGGDVAEDETLDGELSRSATTSPPPAAKEATPAPPPPVRETSTTNSDPQVGEKGIGKAAHDSSENPEIKRPPE